MNSNQQHKISQLILTQALNLLTEKSKGSYLSLASYCFTGVSKETDQKVVDEGLN